VDSAGNPNAASTSTDNKVTADRTLPVLKVELYPGSANVHLRSNTVYFRGSVAGSFRLVNAATDDTVSTSYSAITQPGWTYAGETVASPFVSGPIAWTAGAANTGIVPSANDAAGNLNTRATSIISDTAPPTGGGIFYTDGYVGGLTVPVSVTAATDGGAGLNETAGATRVERRTAALASGVCAAFANTWATVTLIGGADTTVSSGNCYQYRYVAVDNVGNSVTHERVHVTKYDITRPELTGVVNNGTGSIPGLLQQNDTLVFTFTEAVNPQTVPGRATLTMTRSPGGSASLAIPGVIVAGAIPDAYIKNNSTVTVPVAMFVSGNTITVFVDDIPQNAGQLNTSTSLATLTPAATIKDLAGNVVTPVSRTTVLF
jgi:hypothetical protein